MSTVGCSSQQHELTHFLKPLCTSKKGQLKLELLLLLQPVKVGAHSQEQAAERNPVCRETWLWSSLKSVMLVYVKTFLKKSIIVKIIQDIYFPELLSGVAEKASWGSTMHQFPLQKSRGEMNDTSISCSTHAKTWTWRNLRLVIKYFKPSFP